MSMEEHIMFQPFFGILLVFVNKQIQRKCKKNFYLSSNNFFSFYYQISYKLQNVVNQFLKTFNIIFSKEEEKICI